ncbi:uncharacterized protein THITE_70813 [Thermothielavioides terrestris NRRL 8126]|uniref:C2 domain-containing protein n=1 Tax=Thermothielavioides terrestris (strain ATCC 38088 / NRRL 8126) TaxID=578455 RepID=G2QTX7_THETT|nr:uncharacterized protein THITE_70813 [Thermothielavioides terrestris NRRL 8126]AEO63636.1 hypothetical protein THITE_70813 [Thermothielavioides terrestris NRRL 8126]
MTTKAKAHPLNGMHTAGIFSDMSIDGPEIGTLVVVVDRAKNLPNRKTIGKQDPYCAARLGKEAKKTTTDIRGGQTPKWQELRFTVHDSPDYYQLKVSVFNDDKKTELIGETWIDLRAIVVPGGGQSDQWHQLAYKGKYAGEVRIEITYYDSRPKPEKPAVKAKPPVSAEPEGSAAATAGPRSAPKRRPLPSDPVTGKAPASASPAPEQVETPPRPQPNPGPVPPGEYDTAPAAPAQHHYQQHYHQPDHPRGDPNGELGTPSRRTDAPPHQFRTPDRAEQYLAQHQNPGSSPAYQQQPAYDRRKSYDFPSPNGAAGPDDDRPPPPPAHRSRTGSNPAMNGAFQATPPTMRHDVLRSEAHRHSASASYPGRPTYKPYDSAPAAPTGSLYPDADQAPPARHYSYDSAYDTPHRAMQATVEDVPESPESMSNQFRRTSGRWPQPQPQPQFEPDYDMSASPAPLSLSGRASDELARYSHGPVVPDPRHHGTNGYRMPPSDVPQRKSPEYSPNYGRDSELSLPAAGSQGDQRAPYRGEIDDTSHRYPAPPVPASLVPGIDPSLAQEISERIGQDRRQSNQRRHTQQATVETPPRGRPMVQRHDHDGSPAAYNTRPAPAHSRSPVVYTNGPSTSSVNVVIKSRAYSPNPPRDPSPNPHQQHTIRRKSVSPRPPVDNDRRLSGVPFSPDSYDALNPTASSAAINDSAASRPDYHEESGKIITHDGRAVDPSDHLPMESWAPEPEPKQSLSTSPSARPSPSGPQPAPSSGRRQLRVAGRPQSMLPSSSGISFSGSDHVEPATPSPPVSTGRNRLQKKAAYRQSTSAIVPLMSGANGPGPGADRDGFRRSSANGIEPTPLAPIPPHQDNFTPPRHPPRAATFDYAAGPGSENYAPQHQSHPYSTSPGGVPLALPPPSPPGPPSSSSAASGALQLHSSSVARRAGTGIDDGYYDHHAHHPHQAHPAQQQQQQQGYERDVYGGGGSGGGGASLSLEEELRQIDIGSGRSSRKNAAQAQAQVYGQGMGQGYVYGQGGY